jgi:hypothetical protein
MILRILLCGATVFSATSVDRVFAQSIQFTDVTHSAGLVEPLAGLMGHGGAWGDFDGDGRIDFYAGGFADRPDAEYKPATGPVANRLLRNLGNGRFENAKQPPVEVLGRTSGAVFADLDNDGDVDLFVANNAKARDPSDAAKSKSTIQAAAKHLPNRLFRNDRSADGRNTFVDVSAESGACPESLHTARNVGVLDYDGDGLVDLYVVEDRFTNRPRSVLLKNLGGLRFKDVTTEVGLPEDVFGLGLAIADVNDDARPDTFVGHSNRFFLSAAGNKYVESPELAKTFAWQPLDAEDWPCGAAFGDLNRDGRLDLVLSIHGIRARNKVYLNDGLKGGVPRFRDVTAAAGFPDEVPTRCPHVEIQDFDNDGWPDVYFSAAWLDKDAGGVTTITPLVFRNVGATDGIPRFNAPRKIGDPMVYFPAGPSGDFDNDGRLDLLLVNWFAGNHARLLRNESNAKNNWLQVQVAGRTVNRMGIGAKVRVYQAGKSNDAAGLLGYQEIATGYGYASGQPAIAHFGLARVAAVDVVVTLPNGKKIENKNVASNQRLVVSEPK